MDGHPQRRRVTAATPVAAYTYGKGNASGYLLEYPKKGSRLVDGSFAFCNSGLKLSFGYVVITEATEVLLVHEPFE